ncbi:phage/plasmid primase, P4 family [Acidithiobacillus sp.]
MSDLTLNRKVLQTLLTPKPDNIPSVLKDMGWAVSDPTESDGKPPKAPRDASGRLLSPTSSTGWMSFEAACAAQGRAGNFGSFGVRMAGTGLVGIDLDHVQEKFAAYPALSEIVLSAIERGVYLEKSPSGTGLRAFVYAQIPAGGRRKSALGVEIYDNARYLRVTGHKVKTSQDEVTEGQQLVNDLLGLIGVSDAPAGEMIVDDTPIAPDVIAQVAERVSQRESYLWAGDLGTACASDGSHYGPSEADMALTRIIANTGIELGCSVGQIPALIAPVFGQSGLAQLVHGDGTQKWLTRDDYRQKTIEAVCQGLEVSPVVLRIEAGISRNASADFALAERFAQAHRGGLLWVAELRKWLRWTGTVWSACGHGEETGAAKAVMFALVDEAREIMATDQERGSQAMRKALAVQTAPRINAMLDMAKEEPGMKCSVVELNRDIYRLGVQNGVVDLRTGGLIEATPEQLISKQCAATYNPNAGCPNWLQFLHDVFMGDAELIATVQRAVGYSLTGSNTEEKLFICYGHGHNGKSIFHNVISRIMADYALTAPAEILAYKPGGNPEAKTVMAQMPGCRLVGMNETEMGDRLDERVLKTLAGREAISARPPYGQYFTFTPQFTPWLRTNHKPIITGTGLGVWRRLVLIPFKQQFTGGVSGEKLEADLMAEADGILAWMVEGAVQWRRGGLELCSTIKREVQGYRDESDLLGQFLQERTVTTPDTKVNQHTLYVAWQAWCSGEGVKPTSKASLTRRLGELGHAAVKSNGQRFYAGLSLVPGELAGAAVPSTV